MLAVLHFSASKPLNILFWFLPEKPSSLYLLCVYYVVVLLQSLSSSGPELIKPAVTARQRGLKEVTVEGSEQGMGGMLSLGVNAALCMLWAP